MWGETKEGVKRYCIQPEELLDLLKAIGSDNLGICWDTEHGAIENLDQDKAIAKVGPYLRATHISDQTDRGNVHVLPYTGNTDWDMILKALAKADYKGLLPMRSSIIFLLCRRSWCRMPSFSATK